MKIGVSAVLGAVIGDIAGSAYEWKPTKRKDFPLESSATRFTDDTVLTIAIADAILNKKDFAENLKYFGRRYMNRGYGERFLKWLKSDNFLPYNSWGNGSAMRVSAVGAAYKTVDEVLYMAKKSAEVTHNHPEGIKGAQAVALSIFLARSEFSKKEIKEYIEKKFNYDLGRTLDEIRPRYAFDVSCQGSVPESIISFLESDNFEDAIRNAISLGGDADTMASISGAIAAAFYKDIPDGLVAIAVKYLPDEFIKTLSNFAKKYCLRN